MNPNTPPKFNDYELGPSFERARTQIATPFQYIDIPLDIATANANYDVAGDFLYIDPASTGTLTLEVNNQYASAECPFLAQPGFALKAVFARIKLSWNAQAGKFVRLMYSTGQEVVPAFSAAVNVTGTVNLAAGAQVALTGAPYGASYKSVTALAANTPATVFTPAANVNGAIVQAASLLSSNSAGLLNNPTLIAKASAPASVIDGDVIADTTQVGISGNAVLEIATIVNPIRIPAGMGLYCISTLAETYASRSVLYNLL